MACSKSYRRKKSVVLINSRATTTSRRQMDSEFMMGCDRDICLFVHPDAKIMAASSFLAIRNLNEKDGLATVPCGFPLRDSTLHRLCENIADGGHFLAMKARFTKLANHRTNRVTRLFLWTGLLRSECRNEPTLPRLFTGHGPGTNQESRVVVAL
jgi:hypothetical protein